jgi:dienelactone hydrolase
MWQSEVEQDETVVKTDPRFRLLTLSDRLDHRAWRKRLRLGWPVYGVLAFVLVAGAATAAHGASPARRAPRPAAAPHSLAVGLRVLRLVDRTRSIRLPGGRSEPRPLVTYVRYPAVGNPSGGDFVDAPAARALGPFPLIVFGHGYAVTPAVYAQLLRSWTRAGYVVAAPVFPLGNANAPGGPDESDIVNQPADMSFVITQLLAKSAAPGSPLSGLIDPSRIAVAGHSDGGETALAVAYDHRFRDDRVRAAAILSGAEIPGPRPFRFPRLSPPLLAAQGSADTVNLPRVTRAFYAIAPQPKFLLTLIGAAHLPPYTSERPELRVVERVTIAFFDRYLGKGGTLSALLAAGAVPDVARIAGAP